MSRPFLIPIALALALALAAPAAAQAPAERAFAGPLGSISMARTAEPGADGAAALTAKLRLNTSVASDAGARYILVSVGNDAATDLVVHIRNVTGDAGGAAEWTETQGTYRAQWWMDARALPSTVDLVVSATAAPGASAVDVETLVMAFDASYVALSHADGTPLLLQSFTTVAGNPAAPPDFQDPAVNETEDDVDDNPMNDTLDNDTPQMDDTTQESGGKGIPGFGGLAALAAGVAVAALVARRR